MDRKCSLSIHAVTWGFPSSASRTLAWTNQPEFSWVFKFVWGGGVKENVFIVFVHISHFLPKYVDIKACMAYAHMFLDWFSLSSLTCNIHDSRLNQRCRVFLLCFCFWVFKGIICASSSHFCTQMHSIFYITWYCNKLHLQKRLWLLWMSSCATLWNCRLLRVRGGWQPLLLIWQENFIQMCSFTEKPSCSDSACKSDQNVCELVHACVCTREGGDAWCVMIALMVSGYLCRGMMSNATHTCSLLSFCSSTHTRA